MPEALAGERLDRAVALLTGWTRREVQDLVEAGSVLVDGARVTKSRKLEAGSVIEVLARARGRRAARARPDGRGRGAPRGRRRRRRGQARRSRRAPGCRPSRRHAGERPARPLPGDRRRRRSGPARASCTGSTATPAGCSSWPARRRVRGAGRDARRPRRRAALRRAGVGHPRLARGRDRRADRPVGASTRRGCRSARAAARRAPATRS